MDKFSRKQIVIRPKLLVELLELRSAGQVQPGSINLQRYTKLLEGIAFSKTPQGYDYWLKRYYWFADLDIPGANYLPLAEEMTEEDWKYLESLIEPVDKFLTEKENKEYVDFAIAIAFKV